MTPLPSDSSHRSSEKQERLESLNKRSSDDKETSSEKSSTPKVTDDKNSSAASKMAKHAIGSSETGRKALEVAEKVKKTAIAAKATALWFLKAGKALLISLSPPYGFMVWAVIIALIAVGYSGYSAYLITGKNDTTDVCGDPNSVNNKIGSISMDATEREVASEIANALTSTNLAAFGNRPMTVDQAAALIGNYIVESPGLRPYVREGQIGDTTLMSNSEVKQWRAKRTADVQAGKVPPYGTAVGIPARGYGAALGLSQWDGPRADNLIKFAESKGSQWYEFDVQVEFMMEEIDGAYRNGLSNSSPLQSENSSLDDKVIAVHDVMIISAGLHNSERIAAAHEFMKYYDGGSYAGNHEITVCNSTSNLNATEVAEAAMQMAWEYQDINKAKTNCSFNTNGGRACGRSFAKPEYVEGKAAAEEQTGADTLVNGELFASCDRFVATVLRYTGTDTEVPWGSATTQKQYYDSSSQWKQVANGTPGSIDWSSLHPGDVIASLAPAHVAIYIGEVNGEPYVAHATIQAVFSNNGNGMTGYQAPINSLTSRAEHWVYRHQG